MLKIGISTKGDVQKKLQTLSDALVKNRAKITSKISKEISVLLRKKFLSNGGESWWQSAANTIFKSNTVDTATVSVKQVGVRLQRYGGTVLPKRGKNLAIPLKREFRGKNPRELTGKSLFSFSSRRATGKRFLAFNEGKAIRVAYLLTPKATIKPHPEKFLSDSQILDATNEIVELYTQKAYGLSI